MTAWLCSMHRLALCLSGACFVPQALAQWGDTLGGSHSYCPGLSVGTKPGRDDVVRNGLTVDPFTFDSPADMRNTISSEDYETNFYFHKADRPVRVDLSYNYTAASLDKLMSPILRGDMAAGRSHSVGDHHVYTADVNSTTSDLSVVYNCYDAGGTSMIWLQLHISSIDAQEACGTNGNEPLDIVILWTKFCRRKLDFRSGIDIGLEPATDEVVRNGQVTIEFEEDLHTLVVPPAARTTSFYLRTADGTTQVFGPPRLEVDETVMVVSTEGIHKEGGIMSSVPSELTVYYMCGKADIEVDITMTIDLCSHNTEPKDCDPSQNFGYEPIQLQWVKTCGEVYIANLSHDLFLMFFLAGSILCVFGCCFNYTVKQQRGLAIIPCNDALRFLFPNEMPPPAPSSQTPDVSNYRRTVTSIAPIERHESHDGVVTVSFDDAGTAVSTYQTGPQNDDDGEFGTADF